MTKQEILQKHCTGPCQFLDENSIDGYTDNVYEAMDEYAKEHLFEFLKFREKYQRKERDEYIEYSAKHGMISWIGATDEKIYEAFIAPQTQTSNTDTNPHP